MGGTAAHMGQGGRACMPAPWAAGKVEAQALQWEGERASTFEARKWGMLIHSLKCVSVYSIYA